MIATDCKTEDERFFLSRVRACGAVDAGFACARQVLERMSDESRAKAMEQMPQMRGIICAAFPYFCGDGGGNISLYARSADYHIVVKNRLEAVIAQCGARFPKNKFLAFADVSPFPEVFAASVAGLGKIGDNGLLITPKYGSYVFIGLIVTDFEIKAPQSQPRYCGHCGACQRACAGTAFNKNGAIDESRCLSAITQKRGTLSPWQTALIKKYSMVWGCDICQRVCPENINVESTPIDELKCDLIENLNKSDIAGLSDAMFRQKYRGRAFTWRGLAPIRRNIGIVEDNMESVTLRNAKADDFERLMEIESICFPPAEAAGRDSMEKRLKAFDDCFFVAELDGKIIGFINGMATDNEVISDEMFDEIGLHRKDGRWQSIFGLDVLPEYRRQGVAEKLMRRMIESAKNSAKSGLILTCKEHLIKYYEKFGYENMGVSKSVHGGAVWYDMTHKL